MAFMSIENDSGLMKEGEYECYVKDCGLGYTKTEREVIKFDFVVRDDVGQSYKGKHIFKNFYRDDTTGEWPSDKIGKYANALGIEKGQEFELSDLVGRSCIVRIKHFTTDSGETKECIFYLAPCKVNPYMSDLPSFGKVEDDEMGDQLPF